MVYIQLEDVAHSTACQGATTANCDAVYALVSFGHARNWRSESRLDRSAAQTEFRNERSVPLDVVVI